MHLIWRNESMRKLGKKTKNRKPLRVQKQWYDVLRIYCDSVMSWVSEMPTKWKPQPWVVRFGPVQRGRVFHESGGAPNNWSCVWHWLQNVRCWLGSNALHCLGMEVYPTAIYSSFAVQNWAMHWELTELGISGIKVCEKWMSRDHDVGTNCIPVGCRIQQNKLLPAMLQASNRLRSGTPRLESVTEFWCWKKYKKIAWVLTDMVKPVFTQCGMQPVTNSSKWLENNCS